MPEIIQLIGYILIFGAILYLAYIAARLVGKKTSASMQSKHMQVVEQISIGLDKRLLLVRVGSEHFLFLCGKREFKQVARVKLDEEETLEQAEESGTEQFGFNFRQIFDKYVHRQNEKEQMNIKRNDAEPKQGKRGNLKRNIHKLEHLREKGYDKEV
ncbi:MAG: FliO/MopB family protein [Clostridiaceae bacterium]|jgi:flagellar protein FliO/FliZ|nr:FliO/MopB family protein [Clostridiaceae bacterium]